jgi:hypothetical protein
MTKDNIFQSTSWKWIESILIKEIPNFSISSTTTYFHDYSNIELWG